ncbi:zinc finger protein 414 isoform X2 [Symphalangus syndactylus]|uniref:zinc finger protein 414 isoform X2 n=1 Tax=Symphalangus syndactylus TaxID=9590 RepID=UPI003004186A
MEEKPSGPSPDMLATAEPSSSETDKEALSPAVPAAAPSSMSEEPGPEQTATPPVWERGGAGGMQQGSSPAPDSCQPGPGPSPGLTSIVSGTSEDLRPPRRRPPPGKQIPCSSPGCCLSFPSIRDLAQHLRTHCPPTQSLEGKLFRCSALSCTETFPSMQELVAHSKLHYKPNRYFKCENCLLRFRTHRSLFKHLHVCAEHAQSPAPPPPPALDREPPAPERPPEVDPASAPGLPFPLLEPFTTPAPAPTGPFLPYLNPAPFGLSPPRLRPFLAAAPGPPASSAAVWKKGQAPEDPRAAPTRPQVRAGDHQGGVEGLSVLPSAGSGGYQEAAVPIPFPGGHKCHRPEIQDFCLKNDWHLRLHLRRRSRVNLAPLSPFTSERAFPRQ